LAVVAGMKKLNDHEEQIKVEWLKKERKKIQYAGNSSKFVLYLFLLRFDVF